MVYHFQLEVVFKTGNLYPSVSCVGNLLAPLDIYACLKWIQQDPISPSQNPIGYLTAENRDTWAYTRRLLMENNSSQMEAIDSALFNLVLDDVDTDNDPVKISKLFLHGNGANRYKKKLKKKALAAVERWYRLHYTKKSETWF